VILVVHAQVEGVAMRVVQRRQRRQEPGFQRVVVDRHADVAMRQVRIGQEIG